MINYKELIMKQILLLVLLIYCLEVNGQNNDKPFALGTVKEIQSSQLSEKRILNIYLPEGYKENDTIKYPVIYLLDGSADEDFIHICGIVQFFNMMDMMPKSIVVGIANVDRKRDFTYPTTIEKDKKAYPTTGSSEKFIAFIEQELEPFIEKKYRTNSSKTIIGQSLGGLVAVEILFKKPSLFNTYIIVSPSLWWDNESLLLKSPEVLNPSFNQRTTVYIAAGNEGDIMVGDAKHLVKILKKDERKNLNVIYNYLPDEDHATILHQAVYRAFEMLNKKIKKE